MLGAGYGDREWLDRELPIVASGTDEPWGVGFLTWAIDADAVQRVLEYGTRAVMFSFGDPSPFVELVRAAGAGLIIQATDLEEARQAAELGADVIVAQGTEAGGHGARRGRSTLPFVPVVVDLVGPIPVLAAGGIVEGGGQDTERSRVLDIARNSSWPSQYTARTLGHPYLDRWRGREAELAADPQARQDYQGDVARGVIPPLPRWAGEAVDLITDVPSASDLVVTLAAEAEEALARAGRR